MFDLKPVWAGPAPPHSSPHTWSHSDHWSQHSAHLSPPASTLCWYMRYLRELFPTLDWLSLSCDMLTVLLLTSLLIVPGRAELITVLGWSWQHRSPARVTRPVLHSPALLTPFTVIIITLVTGCSAELSCHVSSLASPSTITFQHLDQSCKWLWPQWLLCDSSLRFNLETLRFAKKIRALHDSSTLTGSQNYLVPMQRKNILSFTHARGYSYCPQCFVPAQGLNICNNGPSLSGTWYKSTSPLRFAGKWRLFVCWHAPVFVGERLIFCNVSHCHGETEWLIKYFSL